MPTEPTREELLAQVASLQAELSSRAPQRVAVPRALLIPRRGRSTDPNVIQSQIDQLTTIITSGVNSAGYGDKRSEFRSLSELRQILNDLEEDLAEALGQGGRIRQIRVTTQADKGL
jgi:KaiC/GvpD/RAD55 family RecA-like ATPase